MTHRFSSYEPFKGDFKGKTKGALVSMEPGQSTAYSIDKLQDRGKFFIAPGEKIYIGQIVGEHTRENDLPVNIVKGKKMSNVRASGTDESAKIAPKIEFSLEESMEYIRQDEYLEVTPESLRMRKIVMMKT
jgi:GTP-binding protein